MIIRLHHDRPEFVKANNYPQANIMCINKVGKNFLCKETPVRSIHHWWSDDLHMKNNLKRTEYKLSWTRISTTVCHFCLERSFVFVLSPPPHDFIHICNFIIIHHGNRMWLKAKTWAWKQMKSFLQGKFLVFIVWLRTPKTSQIFNLWGWRIFLKLNRLKCFFQ